MVPCCHYQYDRSFYKKLYILNWKIENYEPLKINNWFVLQKWKEMKIKSAWTMKTGQIEQCKTDDCFSMIEMWQIKLSFFNLSCLKHSMIEFIHYSFSILRFLIAFQFELWKTNKWIMENMSNWKMANHFKNEKWNIE